MEIPETVKNLEICWEVVRDLSRRVAYLEAAHACNHFCAEFWVKQHDPAQAITGKWFWPVSLDTLPRHVLDEMDHCYYDSKKDARRGLARAARKAYDKGWRP